VTVLCGRMSPHVDELSREANAIRQDKQRSG
jgi:hypothetical protein